MAQRHPNLGGDAALVACAVGWGATFPMLHAALKDASPITFNGARFLLASLVLAWALVRPGVAEVRRAAGWGALLGITLAAGFSLQAWAIPSVGPTRSAFLTAFYVLFTPPIEWLATGRRPSAAAALGALLAFVGAVVMTGTGRQAGISLAAIATLAAALLFAIQVVGLHLAIARHSLRSLLFTEVLAAGVLCAASAPLLESPRFDPTPGMLTRLAFLAIVATALLLGLQAYGQSHTTATRAAILFASEPIWAALFGRLAGESLSGNEIFGAATILAGILVATVHGGPAGSGPDLPLGEQAPEDDPRRPL